MAKRHTAWSGLHRGVRPAKSVKRQSTALAVRGERKPAAKRPASATELPGDSIAGWRRLDDAPMLPPDFGQRNPLSKHEREMFNTPVDLGVVRVLPGGEIYVKHTDYTRFCNRVFGVGEWALVQNGRPLSNGKTFVTPYVLYIHGVPMAGAVGEQEYFENNPKQTQGSAIESTYASGLRRTLKHIGLWSELWDPEFGEDFKREHCVRGEGGWRRKDQGALKGEAPRRNGGRKRQQEQQQRNEHAAHEAELLMDDTATISDEAVVRFWQLSRERGRDDGEVRAWLATYGYTRVEKIKVKYYDAICRAVRSPGELPERRRSLPGGE